MFLIEVHRNDGLHCTLEMEFSNPNFYNYPSKNLTTQVVTVLSGENCYKNIVMVDKLS